MSLPQASGGPPIPPRADSSQRSSTSERKNTSSHEPTRTCVGCRSTAPAAQLVRVVWDGAALHVSRVAPGRGAWLHPTPACVTAAARKSALSRAFRTAVPSQAILNLADAIVA
ncbi:MAG: YlxR family protein [Propionibacteriaceae bacterium]|nr:YlxR family protein [Propionibacteriaceae bacterium]